jgi:hypothetical protein
VLPLSKTTIVSSGRSNAAAAQAVAVKVQTTLSAFYDAAFMDPKARGQGPASAAWNAFARPAQERAKADAESLTLGEAGSGIDRLSVTEASLSVRMLLDPRGRPQAAIAVVVFDASGTLKSGDAVLVSNRASFFLRPAGDNWLVVGYPSAHTEVQASAPTPSPAASASASPTTSASPTSGASP